MPAFTLAIEISNPSSGPRGTVEVDGRRVVAGPSVALAREDDPGASDAEALHEHGRHDDDLMPAIDRLFRRNNAEPSQLANIAVSIGPGGYTSLRIAVATAKMLAEATGGSVLPIESWRVAGARELPGPTLVCLASKNNSAWGALLPDRGPLGIITAEHIQSLAPRALIADRFLPEPLRAAASEIGAPILEPVFSAETVLRLAAGAQPIDPMQLAPLYPRVAEAVTQWRRLHRHP